ncbi:calpastatin [Rhizomicrobium sp. SCGC AG-212-E05]|nr:calpastatin [Rhizomicrobium sp. SCGC AG-212-E05]
MTPQRFIEAQDGVYQQVLAELKAGAKRSHWMWFIFPQIAGLGHSAMAQRYAIANIEEARAYLAHPLLGERLRECTQAVLDVSGKGAHQIFGSPDDLKFRSSMTLFDQASPDGIFRVALDKYFDGKDDPLTISKLA